MHTMLDAVAVVLVGVGSTLLGLAVLDWVGATHFVLRAVLP